MNATRTPTSKGAGTSGGASTIQLALVLGFVALVAAAYGALRAGHALTGTGASIPGNPFQALIEVATGKLVWPTVSTVLLVLGALAVLALVFLAGYLRRQRRGPSASIDARAKLMASPSQLTGVTGKQARDKARRLRPELAEVTDRHLEARDIGVVVGRTVVGRKDVFMSWEDVLLAVAGPRMGKTAALAINALCSAPGPALFTSNKRDGHDLTRGVLLVHAERAATAKREVHLLGRFTSAHPTVPIVGVPSLPFEVADRVALRAVAEQITGRG